MALKTADTTVTIPLNTVLKTGINTLPRNAPIAVKAGKRIFCHEPTIKLKTA